MASSTPVSSPRKIINGHKSTLLQTSLLENRNKKTKSDIYFWGPINIVVLSLILYDLKYSCYFYLSTKQYIECLIALILFVNIIHYFYKYVRINKTSKENPCVNTESNVTPTKGLDTSWNLPTINVTPVLGSPNISGLQSTPMNMSAISWMSNTTPDESQSMSILSNSWVYKPGKTSSKYVSLPQLDYTGTNDVTDEVSLRKYLKDVEMKEKIFEATCGAKQSRNSLNSFWSFPTTKNADDVSSYLKNSQFQLSTPASSPSHSPKSEELGSPRNSSTQGTEIWANLNIDAIVLTQWNANLRMWISQTILNRLLKEFENVNEAFKRHSLADMEIGKVGLHRLRKTTQTALVIQNIPTLPTLVPFLEMTPNQEYIVRRIKELAKGGSMSEFKWNGGGSHDGKEWDTSLPTDSAVVMHLLSCYLDTQLMPLPNKPDVKPFSGYHFIKVREKLPELTNDTLLIQEVTEHPPHYRVVLGKEIFEIVKGYNNLFHTILLFLHHLNEKEDGMLGRVNLGRSGVNILWIIQDK